MKTNFAKLTSLLQSGTAATAIMLSLLSGTANAQPPLAHGARMKAPNIGTSTKRLIPFTPAQQKARKQILRSAANLAPIVVQAHPITAPVKLSAALDLTGPGTVLPGHVPSAVSRATKIGPMDQNSQLTLTFQLRPRNQAQMDELAKRLYNPQDPSYHQFIKPAERIAHFSPSQDDFNKVVAFAQQKGLRITNSTIDRQLVMTTGTVGQIQNALGIHLDNYQAADKTTFYSPDHNPTVPTAIAPLLSGIDHLNNANRPRSTAIPRSSLPEQPALGGDNHAQPLDIGIWSATGMPAGELTYCYDLGIQTSDGTPINGAGQRLALVELGGYDPNDISYYRWYNANIASPSRNLDATPLQPHLMDGYGGGLNGDSAEVELDIELVEAVASGLDAIDVYEEDSDGSVGDELNQILNDDLDNQVSISYDYDEDASGAQYIQYYINSTTEQMALQGQAVFVASGDWGAYGYSGAGLTVNSFASVPFVTGVGGTTLWINEFSNYGAFYYENAWNDGGATGGGISQFIGIPDYQLEYLITPGNQASFSSPVSLSFRNVPDVALDSDPYTGYYTHIEGSDKEYGGTSCAAPIWAAFWAQLNQARAIYGISNIGFGNPALYNVAAGSNYNSDFHDVYGGSSNNYYNPTTGYDCTTGLGSIDGVNMINDLINDGSWAPSESFTVDENSVTSGQPIQMSVVLESPIPANSSAIVTYAQLSGGYLYGVGSQQIFSGQQFSSVSVTAPDVASPTQISYICYVTYYGQNGQILGGNHWSNYSSLMVNPNTISGLTVNPSSTSEGVNVTGTVTLNAPAAQNEVINLGSSDTTNASVPANVIVYAGSQSATFTIKTLPVATSEQVTLYANPNYLSGLGITEVTGQLTINRFISNFTISPATVIGGNGSKGLITFAQAAPTNLNLTFKSNSSKVSVTPIYKVKAGQTSVSFPIGTQPVASNLTAQITVSDGVASSSASITVQAPTLKSLSVKPAVVVGPATAVATVNLTGKAPTGGMSCNITSSNPAVVTVPASVTIPAGKTASTFMARVAKVTKATKVTLTVVMPTTGASRTTTLTVNP